MRQDADDWRVEIECLNSGVLEAGFCQEPHQLVGGLRRSRRGGPGTARLRGQGDPAAGTKQTANLAQSSGGLMPESDAVHGQGRIEGGISKHDLVDLLDRRLDKPDGSGTHRGRVTPGRLTDHDLGVVDADHKSLGCPLGQRPYGDTWPTTKLQDAFGRLDVEQSDHPSVALDVGGAMAHDEAGQVAGGPARVMELAHYGAEETLLQDHGFSKRLRVNSKSMPPAPAGTSRSVPSRLLSIGELSVRTGVASTALRYYDDLGLVRPADRASGRRRYAEAAVAEVGVVLLLREVGFSLAEIGSLIGGGERRGWQSVVEHKLEELADQQHRLEVARAALEHVRRCPASEPTQCPRFWAIIEGQLQGLSLEESHARAH